MRPTTEEYFLDMARLVSTRGTCYRRKVGCVLVDSNNRVLATGYNGVASGPHCNQIVLDQSYVSVEGSDRPLVTTASMYPNLCEGAMAPSGTELSKCKATHAEANALISCRNPEDIDTCYCTTSPCEQCIRFLLNTSCRRIVFEEVYPHSESVFVWIGAGRIWTHFVRPK
jgi:dCMP deaminase